MKKHYLLGLGLSAVVAGFAFVRADDAPKSTPSTQPAKHGPSTRPVMIRLTLPWSKIADLTDDQRAKIHEIHEAALKEEDAIKNKEEADIKALLTDGQKTELLDAEAKEKAEAAEKRAEKEKQKINKAATAPAADKKPD